MLDIRVHKINEVKELKKIDNILNVNCIYATETSRIKRFIEKNSCNFFVKSEIEKANYQDKGIIIVISDDVDFVTIAEYYAIVTSRTQKKMFIDEFKEFVLDSDNKDKEICIITDHSNLETIENIMFLNNEILRYGIIWGNNSNDLLYFINKNILSYREPLSKVIEVDRTDKKREELYNDDNYFYLPYAKANKEQLVKSIANKTEVLAFTGHGRDELLWITKGVLCGGDKCSDAKCTPACNNGGKCFKENVDILKISDVNASNLFVGACNSGNMVNPVFGFEYSVLYTFMQEMAVSYMSSPFLCNECEAIIHYYCALVTAGKRMGEVVKLINNLYSSYKIGNKNSFILIGDPRHQVKSKHKEQIVYVDYKDSIEKKQFNIKNKTPLILIKVNKRIFHDFISLKKEVVVRNSIGQTLFAHIYEEDNEAETTIAVFTKGILDEGDYFLSIKDIEYVNESGINEIAYIYELGVMEPKDKRFYEESVKCIKNFYLNKNRLMPNISDIGNLVYKKYEKLVKRVNQIDEQLNTSLWKKIHKKGWSFDELCMSLGFHNRDRALNDRMCPYCGGTLLDSYIEDTINRALRVHTFCNKCGNIEDRPINVRFSAKFQCDTKQFKKDGENTVYLKVKNNSDSRLSGVVSIAMVNGEAEGVNYLPEKLKIKLEQFEEKTIEFKITQNNDIVCHNYWLMGVLSCEMELQIIKMDVFYEEKN